MKMIQLSNLFHVISLDPMLFVLLIASEKVSVAATVTTRKSVYAVDKATIQPGPDQHFSANQFQKEKNMDFIM